MARDPITTPTTNKAGSPKMASSNRIMSIKGPPSSVAKGDLSARKGLNIVNKG